MGLIGGGIALATRTPVSGHFWANLAAPMIITGAGTALAVIPISIAGLTGVSGGQAGLASGLINTTQQLGGSLGVALAATVATTRTHTLLASHHPVPHALTGGFHVAFAVSAAIGAAGILLSLIVPARQEPMSANPDTAPRLEPVATQPYADNPASAAVSRKVGYQDNGTRPELRDGVAADHHKFLLTQATFIRPDEPIEITGGRELREFLGVPRHDDPGGIAS
jgi:hypothetical protein